MLLFSMTSTENVRVDMPSTGRNALAKRAEELIALCAAGSTEALGELYELTRAAVYGFILPLLRNAHDTEDALQDAYIRIWNACEGYAPRGNPMGWIMQIAKNVALMRLREQKRTQVASDEDMELFLPPHTDEEREDRIIIKAALASLTPQEAQIVAMHAEAGMKHREIAHIMDMPLASALSKYHRALKKLKLILTTEGEHE